MVGDIVEYNGANPLFFFHFDIVQSIMMFTCHDLFAFCISCLNFHGLVIALVSH